MNSSSETTKVELTPRELAKNKLRNKLYSSRIGRLGKQQQINMFKEKCEKLGISQEQYEQYINSQKNKNGTNK